MADYPFTLKNSLELVKMIQTFNLIVSNENQFVSYDVVSLFTNIPLVLDLDCFNEIYPPLNITFLQQLFIKAIKFVLESVVFSFRNVFRKIITNWFNFYSVLPMCYIKLVITGLFY